MWGRWSGLSTCHQPSCMGLSLPPHVKTMCAQLGLAHVPGCSRTRWEGCEGEAWPCWVGEGARALGLRLLAEPSGSQTVLTLGASGVCADCLSPLKVESPLALMEERQPCRQRLEGSVRRAQDLLRCLFMKGVPSRWGLGASLDVPGSSQGNPRHRGSG